MRTATVLVTVFAVLAGPGVLTTAASAQETAPATESRQGTTRDLGQITLIEEPGSPPEINLAGDSCLLDDLSNGISHVAMNGAIYGEDIFAVFQNPIAECSEAPYGFEVGGVIFPLRALSGSYTFNIRAQIYAADLTDPACPVPGALLYEGPIVSRTVTTTMTYVEANFDGGLPVRVDGPYFAAMEFPDYFGPNLLLPYFNNPGGTGGVPFVPCASMFEYGSGWQDLGAMVMGGYNMLMWSYGTGLPGGDGCLLDDLTNGISNWSSSLMITPTTNTFAVFQNPIAECSEAPYAFEVQGVIFPLSAYSGSYTFDIRAQIYAADLTDPACPVPGALLYEGPIVSRTVYTTKAYVEANFDGGLPVRVDGPYFAAMKFPDYSGSGILLLYANDPGGTGGVPFVPCASMLYSGSRWYSFEQLFMLKNLLMWSYGTGLLDEKTWATHAHDYARTGASDMTVGTPCNINLAWKANTTRATMRFNNVSVYRGRVYCSDDQAFHCFDLASGALLWTYRDPSGIATASGMRNNPTIYGFRVFGGGGSARSFFCLDTLGNLLWSRHYNSFGHGTGDWLCGQERYAVSVVARCNNNNDTVVYFGDEGGCLWALDATTGLNYAVWGTNPVHVPDGQQIYHSPAYDGHQFLYVATLGGNIYKFDKATGVYTTLFTEPDGDQFSSGCALDTGLAGFDDDMIYAASDGTTPMRFKINAATGAAQWSFAQGNSLYGGPTIGADKVYFPQDNPASGVLVCDKTTGAVEYDFAVDGVGSVTNPATLTSDGHLFVGDRKGDWYLLDAIGKTVIWKRHFQDYVWGTALAHHVGADLIPGTADDKDYAVMSIWSDWSTGGSHGGVFCWDLNGSPRPMMDTLVSQVTIQIPAGTGLITGYHVPNVITNFAGCIDLHVTEPLPAFEVSPNVLRTQNAMLDVPGPISGGEVVGLTWSFDATALGTGTDDEYVEIQHDDPDFYPEDLTPPSVFGWPKFNVHYVGVACECTRWCDLNLDGNINPVDVVRMVNYVYKSIDNRQQVPGCPLTMPPNRNGDWNCDGTANPVDVVRYVNFVYKGQTQFPPCNPCGCTAYPSNCPPWP